MKYFTLIVTIINDEQLTYKNLTEEKIKELQSKIWVQGVKRTINHTTCELISPLVIRKALIKEQEGFINEQI